MAQKRPPRGVLDAYGLGPDARVEPVTVGLINLTFRVEADGRTLALQRLHPIFDGRVNRDIDAITRWLSERGMPTPRLWPTASGALWHEAPDGCWRALSWLEGDVHVRVEGRERARAAGALAGRFHRALHGLEHVFEFRRPDAHHLPTHLAGLRAALAAHPEHPAFAEVERLAARILDHAAELPEPAPLPRRIIHGDLKLTNLLFEGERGRAVLDLDTLAHGTMDVELGDAMRSWCNPRGEDVEDAELELPLFAAALEGFAEGSAGLLAADEWRSVAPATERIAVELASRFARDALEEERFGWDPSRFASRSAHNLLRARGQLGLAQSIRAQRPRLREIVEERAHH